MKRQDPDYAAFVEHKQTEEKPAQLRAQGEALASALKAVFDSNLSGSGIIGVAVGGQQQQPQPWLPPA